jgi:hypothetical protein
MEKQETCTDCKRTATHVVYMPSLFKAQFGIYPAHPMCKRCADRYSHGGFRVEKIITVATVGSK